ncbi:MAG: hypothetical protein CM15mP58_16860 [Burkholderiaceae bacterium]|nr:MAG: hypothetical protein CM15mP58_16860 [Burkholderiaceae bacterium]
MPIVGNIEDVTHNLIDELTEFRKRDWRQIRCLRKWWDEIELWRKKDCLHYKNLMLYKPSL